MFFFFFFPLQAKIESIRNIKEEDAEKLLRVQFKMEMLVYTQDRTYSSSLSESKENEQEMEKEYKSMKKSPEYELMYIRENHATLAELMLHLKSYYRVRVNHSTGQNLFFCFCGGRHLMKCSFFMLQIASQRLADQIPLVIRFHMLQEFAFQLQREMLQLLQDRENVQSLLREDCDVGTKRTVLQSRVKRLTQAREYLAKF